MGQGRPLRVGVWNLEKQAPGSPRGRAQAEQLLQQDADLWLLTEAPVDLRLDGYSVHAGASRPGEPDQVWSAIASRWPIHPVDGAHPTLVMALVDHPLGEILAATSVLPWRGAAAAWPEGDGLVFAERFTRSLDAHAGEIAAARGGRPVLWGGDFNQALSGREYVGSRDGRAKLQEACSVLGLTVVTAQAVGSLDGMAAIDHLAISRELQALSVVVHRPVADGRTLSDHPAYLADLHVRR